MVRGVHQMSWGLESSRYSGTAAMTRNTTVRLEYRSRTRGGIEVLLPRLTLRQANAEVSHTAMTAEVIGDTVVAEHPETVAGQPAARTWRARPPAGCRGYGRWGHGAVRLARRTIHPQTSPRSSSRAACESTCPTSRRQSPDHRGSASPSSRQGRS